MNSEFLVTLFHKQTRLTWNTPYGKKHIINATPIDNKDTDRRGALKAQPPVRRGPLKRRPSRTKTMNRGGASPYLGGTQQPPFRRWQSASVLCMRQFGRFDCRGWRFFSSWCACVWRFYVLFLPFSVLSVSVTCQNVGVLSAPHEPQSGHVARSRRYHARTRI